MKFIPGIKVYGDQSYRGACPVEDAELVTFFAELRRRHPALAAIAIHPENEGKRTHGQAFWSKAKGLAPGASDIVIPACPPLIIEMKRRDHTKSKWEPGQIEYLQSGQSAGATVAVALGWEAAMCAVSDFLQNNSSLSS